MTFFSLISKSATLRRCVIGGIVTVLAVLIGVVYSDRYHQRLRPTESSSGVEQLPAVMRPSVEEQLAFATALENATNEGDIDTWNSLIDWESIANKATRGEFPRTWYGAKKQFKTSFLDPKIGKRSGLRPKLS